MKNIIQPILYGALTFIISVITLGIFISFISFIFPEAFKAYIPFIFFIPSLMIAGKVTFDKTNSIYTSHKLFFAAAVGCLCSISILLIPGFNTYIWWLPIVIGIVGSILAIIGASIGSFKSYVF
jgi:hypothetical protein